MGSGFSGPINNYGDKFRYVVMTMLQYNKFVLIHAPDDVVDAVSRILGYVSDNGVKTKMLM